MNKTSIEIAKKWVLKHDVEGLTQDIKDYASITSEQKQKLFNYIKTEHGVTLLESDIHEIELILKTD